MVPGGSSKKSAARSWTCSPCRAAAHAGTFVSRCVGSFVWHCCMSQLGSMILLACAGWLSWHCCSLGALLFYSSVWHCSMSELGFMELLVCAGGLIMSLLYPQCLAVLQALLVSELLLAIYCTGSQHFCKELSLTVFCVTGNGWDRVRLLPDLGRCCQLPSTSTRRVNETRLEITDIYVDPNTKLLHSSDVG